MTRLDSPEVIRTKDSHEHKYNSTSLSSAFHCPHCHTYAEQHWGYPLIQNRKGQFTQDVARIRSEKVEVSSCAYCKSSTFWLFGRIIYPPSYSAPPANGDLPDEVRKTYEEAASIAHQSSRAACALLRLAIEMLLKHLGETGTINDAIKHLVDKGLDERIQKALDIVRVTGNNAVHPGQIDFSDSTDVLALFELINLIADALITRRKLIDEMYNRLPEKDREYIKKRHTKSS